MNDRFKFRVWNDVLKSYSMDDHFIDEDGKLNTDGNFYTVEQCTGIKDKNGKLIYEGDIVEHKILPDKPKRYIVKWNYTHLCFELQSIKNQLFYDVFIPVYDDVIGNIHENKELLK